MNWITLAYKSRFSNKLVCTSNNYSFEEYEFSRGNLVLVVKKNNVDIITCKHKSFGFYERHFERDDSGVEAHGFEWGFSDVDGECRIMCKRNETYKKDWRDTCLDVVCNSSRYIILDHTTNRFFPATNLEVGFDAGSDPELGIAILSHFFLYSEYTPP